MPGQFITIQEAVKEFDVSEKTLRRNIKKGKVAWSGGGQKGYLLNQEKLARIYQKRRDDQGDPGQGVGRQSRDIDSLKYFFDRFEYLDRNYQRSQNLLTESREKQKEVELKLVEQQKSYEKELLERDFFYRKRILKRNYLLISIGVLFLVSAVWLGYLLIRW